MLLLRLLVLWRMTRAAHEGEELALVLPAAMLLAAWWIVRGAGPRHAEEPEREPDAATADRPVDPPPA
jgi:hypothetical protein